MNNRDVTTNVSQEDFDELIASGLTPEWILNSGARTISGAEAIEMGFSLSAKFEDSNISESVEVLEGCITSCLFLPFYDRDGEEIFDDVTHKQIGVIKPRYIESTIAELANFKAPKYLCLSKSAQSRQYIHHPRGFNWKEFYLNPKNRNQHVTEGWKKSEAACCLGIPCISIYSVYCFNESGMDSPLIPELIEVIRESKIKFVIIFDSDKSINEGVDQAEGMFVDKIANEVRKQAHVINLPQSYNGIPTKGLDDFLKVAGKEGFNKLNVIALFTPFIKASKVSDIPSIPRDSLPEIYKEFIDYVEENFEGCLEIVPVGLFCQGAVALGRTFELNSKKANFYAMGIAGTTEGKSSVCREVTKPIYAINKQLHDEFLNRFENDQKVRGNHFIVSSFTEEGLNYFLSNVVKGPIAMFFEAEEFDNFLAKLNKEYNCSLASYLTKIYDAKYLSPSYSCERQKGPPIRTIYNPAVTIGGVGTDIGILNAMPKNAQVTGFDNRFPKFIGKHRVGKRVIQPKPLPQELDLKMQKILWLPIQANIDHEKTISFSLSKEAEALYASAYGEFKDWEDQNQGSPLIPYFRRSLTDATFKLALQFEVINKAEEVIDQEGPDPQAVFNEWIKESKELLIGKETLIAALEWAKYFFATARYFHEKYLSGDVNFEGNAEKALNILKEHSQGILSSKLRRLLGLHRSRFQKSEYEDIIEMLRESYEVVLEPGKRSSSMIIKLKSHLLVS